MRARINALIAAAFGDEIGQAVGTVEFDLAPFVAAGNQFGCTIIFGHRINRPEGADAQSFARKRLTAMLIVHMPGLNGFTRVQVDRKTG
jgi:hypothetical protein